MCSWTPDFRKSVSMAPSSALFLTPVCFDAVGCTHVDRVFTFDKVFGPKSQQMSIYDQAISPIVAEVLEGFNCTAFAYGQTGTGKTYTKEGGMRNKGDEVPVEAGIIPRAGCQIFDPHES
ncbi:Kinesin-like protein KIN-5B [Salvia divinorum]|uniref:Kinesin-like protein KIN-5B n=1 Tax=Salvia divinorum TaxID=28513 RepID=A0ABD1GP48_SALDI